MLQALAARPQMFAMVEEKALVVLVIGV